ncbi:MAG: (d)CMP kinase [Eubacteriaceae bacterium]|nr:(d)CMP kinase [Eubacteriaceae bacterium]
MTERSIQIAIDGPAGAGKSTVAKQLSERLGILYLDTGAMYRAFAFFCLKNGLGTSPADEQILDAFEHFDLVFEGKTILLNGEDITSVIRTPEIDRAVSPISANPLIREKMVEKQKAVASGRDIVMEGRDICDVVMPDAPYKFYLDASVEERARRRWQQNTDKGIESSLEDIKQDIVRRDEYDSTREATPLAVSRDAVLVDTTGMSLEEVIGLIISKVGEGSI